MTPAEDAETLEANYRDGKMHGTWTYWGKNGLLIKIDEYDQDRLIKDTTFPGGPYW